MSDDLHLDKTERLYGPRRVKRHPWRRYAVLAVGIGFMVLIALAFNQGQIRADSQSIPIIKADAEPFKIKPEQTGGQEIPHQDKLIYEQMGGQTARPVTEKLLSDAEPPILPEPQAAVETAANSAETLPAQEVAVIPTPEITRVNPKVEKTSEPENLSAMLVAQNQEAAPLIAPMLIDKPKPPVPQKTQDNPPPPVPAAKTLPAQVPPRAAAEKIELGGFRVQLAAFPDADQATATAAQWQKKLASVLAGKKIAVIRAEIPNKGVYHRLQIGGFADRRAAQASCAAIKAGGQNCILVAPQ
jgi:hypothetical protein